MTCKLSSASDNLNDSRRKSRFRNGKDCPKLLRALVNESVNECCRCTCKESLFDKLERDFKIGSNPSLFFKAIWQQSDGHGPSGLKLRQLETHRPKCIMKILPNASGNFRSAGLACACAFHGLTCCLPETSSQLRTRRLPVEGLRSGPPGTKRSLTLRWRCLLVSSAVDTAATTW